MQTTVVPRPSTRHRERLDALRPLPAKVLTNREIPDYRARVGAALGRAIAIAGLTIKEAAGLLDRDPAQVSRWIAGTERVQLDAIVAVDRLHGPFVIAIASESAVIDVSTVITVRRTGPAPALDPAVNE